MKVLLLTPPFTQINTPYPATPFLKRFLTGKGVAVKQADMGIDLLLTIFSRKGLQHLFDTAEHSGFKQTKRTSKTLHQSDHYINTIDTVIGFLQTRETSQAYQLCKKGFLPFGVRLDQPFDLDGMFGKQGFIDKACYKATVYLEELSHFIKTSLAPDFGFNRYAERLALAATDFSPIERHVLTHESFFDRLLQQKIYQLLKTESFNLVGITIPFPGCLYGALKCGKYIRETDADLKIAMGGGYVSTELRELKDPAFFKYTDYVILDQGEQPLLKILSHINHESAESSLLRTYLLKKNTVTYQKGDETDAPFEETGYPDYSDLDLKQYLSVIEIPNPMHRLWNDGRWNKLMVSKGCYWKKCAFCDVTLDYIKTFETINAERIVDRMEQIISETGNTGFHFVDEAAPPSVLKQIAIELLRRNLTVSWWTNIRFEKNFSQDLCRLLAKSGCIAVSGGLETASDRLLQLMNKGVSLSQAIHVLNNFAQAGILVHAYLMYGFPTQTEQETVNSLETVRQLFENRLLQSCYWHRFTLTAHSLVAQQPELFRISVIGPEKGSFGWNDLEHKDQNGCMHAKFSQGLEKAVYNYMYDIALDYKLDYWFDFDIPDTTLAADFVKLVLSQKLKGDAVKLEKNMIWLGGKPIVSMQHKQSKKKRANSSVLSIFGHKQMHRVKADPAHALWLKNLLPDLRPHSVPLQTVKTVQEDYERQLKSSFQDFQQTDLWRSLRETGLLIL